MRCLLTGLACVASLAVVAAVAFFVVLVFAGSHSGLAPRAVQGGVLVLGWSAVLILPVLAARSSWRWLAARRPRGASRQ
jgi:hypothetical protein